MILHKKTFLLDVLIHYHYDVIVASHSHSATTSNVDRPTIVMWRLRTQIRRHFLPRCSSAMHTLQSWGESSFYLPNALAALDRL